MQKTVPASNNFVFYKYYQIKPFWQRLKSKGLEKNEKGSYKRKWSNHLPKVVTLLTGHRKFKNLLLLVPVLQEVFSCNCCVDLIPKIIIYWAPSGLAQSNVYYLLVYHFLLLHSNTYWTVYFYANNNAN